MKSLRYPSLSYGLYLHMEVPMNVGESSLPQVLVKEKQDCIDNTLGYILLALFCEEEMPQAQENP